MVLLLGCDGAHVSVDKVAWGEVLPPGADVTGSFCVSECFETTSASGVLPNISLHIPHTYRQFVLLASLPTLLV